MRNALVSSLSVTLLTTATFVTFATAGGCSSDDSKDGTIALPERDPKTDAGKESGTAPPADSGAPAPDCKSMTLKVSDKPACDTCAKDKCCAEVLACDKSNDCKALQACLEPCANDDLVCVLTCQAAHPKGQDALQEVGSCALANCKTECPSETPDSGDPFDSGL